MSQRTLIGMSFILVSAVVISGLYFTFRYTLVADLRESLDTTDRTNLVAYGQTLFATRGCAGCHTLESLGSIGDEGPNLTGIGARHTAEYLAQSIMQPNAVIAEGCPEGPCEANVMPQFGQILSTDQVDALVAFLVTQ